MVDHSLVNELKEVFWDDRKSRKLSAEEINKLKPYLINFYGELEGFDKAFDLARDKYLSEPAL